MAVVNATRVGASGVLGGLVRVIVTVKLSIALPFLLVEAAAVSAAELIRTTCWILCSKKKAKKNKGLFCNLLFENDVMGMRGWIQQPQIRMNPDPTGIAARSEN